MELSRRHQNEAATATYEQTVASLSGTRDPAACTHVAHRVAAAIGAELAALERDGAGIGCAPRCSFCCHQRVAVLPHEAIALHAHLRTGLAPDTAAAVEAGVAANARRVEGLAPHQHHALRLRCALLVDGLCCAYDVRPASCAAYHSLSRARCEHAFAHPQDAGTPRNSRPALLGLQIFCDAQIEATRAAVATAGLDATPGELHGYLRILIEDPSAVSRWLAGDTLR